MKTIHSIYENIIYVNGTANCGCHADYNTPLVYEYIDGISLPEAITLIVFEHFQEKQQLLTPILIDITVKLDISGTRKLANVRVAVDRTAYGVVFNEILYKRGAFLCVVRKLFIQLKDQVAASEMYAPNQAIAAIIDWIKRGDQLKEHDRLRELIKYAIDEAYHSPI